MRDENNALNGRRRSPTTGHELLEGLYEAVLLLGMDGRITEANRRAEQFLRVESGDLLGQPIEQFVAGLDEALLQRVLNNLAEGRFTVLNAYCLRRDGTYFPAEVAINRVILSSGEDRLVLTARNIEQRRRIEATLRTFQQAVENAASAMALTDADGCIEYVNLSFRDLWSLVVDSAPKGRMLAELWDPTDERAAQIWSALAQSQSWTGELRLRTAGGHIRHVQATAAVNRNEHGEPTGLIFSFSDMTPLRQALDKIEREAAAVIARARNAGDFSGPLNIVSIPDLLQLIDGATKSGWLRILDAQGSIEAEVGFREGQIVEARRGALSGEAAAVSLVCEGGDSFAFEQRSAEEIPITGLNLNAMHVLLEAARRQDEESAGAAHADKSS